MHQFPQLNLPAFGARVRPDADSVRGGLEIYDALRRKWVALTPEEWVRQNFVNFLVAERGYPAALMANEVEIKLNGLSRRCDTVVYDTRLQPRVVVEYKAPSVAITQKVFDQIARYNIVVNAGVLIVSNGLRHYCCRFDGEGYRFLRDVPPYAQL
ncbi:MAG: type I restriction enzyme HsdR N-terminal domain-containing protein [Muribaculaceae bacterium]|nr:type I restriction enzyme HsdR N-terminal domain-containing protein [Bacteroidales bacterium]MDE6436727.1 type I restriction enzyme HsdR N-terminal domain-containing protein [Muribaculaceae bacterium]